MLNLQSWGILFPYIYGNSRAAWWNRFFGRQKGPVQPPLEKLQGGVDVMVLGAIPCVSQSCSPQMSFKCACISSRNMRVGDKRLQVEISRILVGVEIHAFYCRLWALRAASLAATASGAATCRCIR